MAASESSRLLKEVVTTRARELRDGSVGYAEAVRVLAEELYANERGKESRIGELGAPRGLVGSAPGVRERDAALPAKTKKGKAKAISAITTLISAWVADAYEEA